MHHGTICPHCGVHFRPAVPFWVVFLATVIGWAVIFVGVDFLGASDVVVLLASAIWLACVAFWYATRPLIVIPEQSNL